MKKYHKQNCAAFAGALVSILISNAVAVWLQFFKGDVLDFAVAGQTQAALRHALFLITAILTEVLFYFLHRRFSIRYVVSCTKNLKRDVFESILRRSYIAYRARPQGEYLAKYTNEADAIRARRFEMLPMFWDILSKVLFVSAALFMLDTRIACVTIALLTTPLYVPKLIEKRLQRVQTESLKAAEEALSSISDWLSGFEIIKNYSIERQIRARFECVNSEAMDKNLQDARLGAVAQLITTLISYLSYFIVLACSTALVLSGDFSAGDFFIAIGMIDQLSYPLISLAGIIRQLVAIRPACEAMESFLAEAAEADEGTMPPFRHEICFRNVSFAYDGGPTVLKDFDLSLPHGTRCLLRGPSGCGKTTAINLLLRYYDVCTGSIEIDGTPIETLGSPYSCMTVVRQEAVLFRGTLRENLTMFRDIADEKLTSVLFSLGLEKYASAEALDSPVEEHGSNFSGGEKKRICLARALLRDTEVLLLDEPLANLDDETARRIEDLLLSIENRTVLIVSHQFSDEKLRSFDQVLTLSANA